VLHPSMRDVLCHVHRLLPRQWTHVLHPEWVTVTLLLAGIGKLNHWIDGKLRR